MYDPDQVAFFRLCENCGHGHVRHGFYRTIDDAPQPQACDYCEVHCPGYLGPPLRSVSAFERPGALGYGRPGRPPLRHRHVRTPGKLLGCE